MRHETNLSIIDIVIVATVIVEFVQKVFCWICSRRSVEQLVEPSRTINLVFDLWEPCCANHGQPRYYYYQVMKVFKEMGYHFLVEMFYQKSMLNLVFQLHVGCTVFLVGSKYCGFQAFQPKSPNSQKFTAIFQQVKNFVMNDLVLRICLPLVNQKISRNRAKYTHMYMHIFAYLVIPNLVKLVVIPEDKLNLEYLIFFISVDEVIDHFQVINTTHPHTTHTSFVPQLFNFLQCCIIIHHRVAQRNQSSLLVCCVKSLFFI
eukprot:TRINITY_DN25674_c2_g1_i1.p2 TRINITY_DN25674_c2_g1~~TRINITY_DN25674_c2_g1_i1.p2  ORF type:complete len:260 (+),score=-12.18 TRINITY_DN25674_c2_g1_i1:52-831(+)